MLVVDAISHSFQRRSLFQGVSFTVPPGQLLRIQGPNGVGKTTLLRLLAGLHKPRQGTISMPNSWEYLPAEGNALFSSLDACRNLRFWSQLRGLSLENSEIRQALLIWKIPAALLELQFPVGKMSTGMRRRIALCRLSLSQTQYWLLDEPTSGLDIEGQSAFISLVHNHLAKGGSAILVSHDEALSTTLQPTLLDLAHYAI